MEDGGLIDPLLAAPDGNGATKTTKTKECGAEGKYWVAADEAERRAVTECGAEDGRRPLLFRTYKLRGAILHPYRYPPNSRSQTELLLGLGIAYTPYHAYESEEHHTSFVGS